jgi:hypothetical protein
MLVVSCNKAPAAVQAGSHTAAAESKRAAAHDREFWRGIARNHFAVPAGEPVYPLMRELSGYLGSNDPELRDDLAYTILAVWIRHQKQLTTKELLPLVEEWRANLRAGIGERGTDSVFKRSFSALCLASMAERDVHDPFLGEERYRVLLGDALDYLAQERDLRGFDGVKGWIHATAHTADLLSALASNRLFKREDQARLLDAIVQRLWSAPEIFTYGEQDRLAMVAATIATRSDFDPATFERWLTRLSVNDQKAWNDSPPKQQRLNAFENDTYMLRALAAHLAAAGATPAAANAQRMVSGLLQRR